MVTEGVPDLRFRDVSYGLRWFPSGQALPPIHRLTQAELSGRWSGLDSEGCAQLDYLGWGVAGGGCVVAEPAVSVVAPAVDVACCIERTRMRHTGSDSCDVC